MFKKELQNLFIKQLPNLDRQDFWAEESADPIFDDKYGQLRANVGWVGIANNIVSKAISKVELKVVEVQEDGTEIELFNHELIKLLKRPNAIMTGKQFRKLFNTFLNLNGEAYAVIRGDFGKPWEDHRKWPTSLQILETPAVGFDLNKNYYQDSLIRYGGNSYKLASVLRQYNPNPENLMKGLSIIQQNASAIDTDEMMRKWNRKVFKNSGRPSVALEVPTALDDKAYKRIKKEFNSEYTGEKNAFKAVVLDNGMKITPYTLNSQDLDFLDSRKFSKDEIFAMFGISPSNAGMTENVNRANAEAQDYTMAKNVVEDGVADFCEQINNTIVEPYNAVSGVRPIKLTYENPVPEDLEFKLKLAGEGVNKFMTIDEVRELYGLKELPDGQGNVLYRPLNEVPITDLSFTDELGDTDIDEREFQQCDDPDHHHEKKKVAGETIRKYERKARLYARQARKYERMISGKALTVMEKQRKQALTYTKAFESMDWQNDNTELAEFIQEVLQMVIEQVGVEALNEIAFGGELNLYQGDARRWAEAWSKLVAKHFNETTRLALQTILENSMTEGMSVDETADKIDQYFDGVGKERAWVLAQTESVRAMTYADINAWRLTGEVEDKEWYTAEDERVCAVCAELHGNRIGLTVDYFKKGDRLLIERDDRPTLEVDFAFSDVSGPPLHPRCRCVLIPILREL